MDKTSKGAWLLAQSKSLDAMTGTGAGAYSPFGGKISQGRRELALIAALPQIGPGRVGFQNRLSAAPKPRGFVCLARGLIKGGSLALFLLFGMFFGLSGAPLCSHRVQLAGGSGIVRRRLASDRLDRG
jgi:hypothetical protein